MKFRLEGLNDLKSLVKELAQGLRKLNFSDNWESFEKDIEIDATSSIEIRNELQFIPSRYIVVDQTGNGLITRHTTAWSSDYLYLYNNGSVSVTATVIFLK